MVITTYKYRPLTRPKTRQSGVVLIVALVFLIALTAVAAALMQNTTTDIKMAGASQEKSIATQEIMSEMDRVIFNEEQKIIGGINRFALSQEIYAAQVPLTVTEPDTTTGTILGSNQYSLDTHCSHMNNASSVGTFNCRALKVQVSRTYGRNNNSQIQVNAGIVKLIPKVNG